MGWDGMKEVSRRAIPYLCTRNSFEASHHMCVGLEGEYPFPEPTNGMIGKAGVESWRKSRAVRLRVVGCGKQKKKWDSENDQLFIVWGGENGG